MRTTCTPLALSLILTLGAHAQDANLPSPRSSAVFVYHPASKAMLLLDGYQVMLDSPRTDVWKWNGKQWAVITGDGPSTRSLTAAALNTRTGEVVSFGGIRKDYQHLNGDTWSFDGQTWKRVATNDIGTRDHHEMVYARHLDAFVLYGGVNQKRENDTATWLLRNGKFTALNIPGPGARYHFAMAYDPKRKKVVLHGGGPSDNRVDEVWEFDGKKWERISYPSGPGMRMRHAMTYDSENKLVILHGDDNNGTTWGWNGIVWKVVAQGGPVLSSQALGYDPVRKTVVLYGGTPRNGLMASDLWELKDGKWKKLMGNGTLQYMQSENGWKWMPE